MTDNKPTCPAGWASCSARAELQAAESRVKELEAERDEARREVCFLEETVVSEQGYSEDAQELATARGWSYLFIGKKE